MIPAPQYPEAATTRSDTEAASTNPAPAEKKRSNFALGIRAGYSIAGGDAWEAEPLSDTISGAVRLQLDVDYHVIPQLALGAYLNLGFGIKGDEFERSCDAANADCNAINGGLGVHIQYHVTPDSLVNPWVGVGVGGEVLSRAVHAGSYDVTTSAIGLEGNVSAGVGFRVGPLVVGPFAAYQIGTYSSISVEAEGYDYGDEDIDQTASHSWLTFGIRGQYWPR